MLTAFFRRTTPTMIAKLSADQAIALVGQELCTLEDLRALHRAMLSWSDATTYQFVIGSGFQLLASKVLQTVVAGAAVSRCWCCSVSLLVLQRVVAGAGVSRCWC